MLFFFFLEIKYYAIRLFEHQPYKKRDSLLVIKDHNLK